MNDTDRIAEEWHPCEHCKQFDKSVKILDAHSYSVGDARDWESAVSICEAHNSAIEKATEHERKAHEDTLTAAKHERQFKDETIRQLRAAQPDDTKRLIEGLNRLYALVDANCLPQAKRAYDAAMRKEKPHYSWIDNPPPSPRR